jgi:NifU-like protein involved in Fe-S cluster formation
MVGDALRAVMQAAPGAGELAGDGARHGHAEHPVCGDRVEVSVRVAAARVEALAWRALGCPASVAVAAAAHAALVGQPVAEAAVRLRQRLDGLGGLAPHERHAEQMFLRAFRAAVGDEG